jgi:hypothetical protein
MSKKMLKPSFIIIFLSFMVGCSQQASNVKLELTSSFVFGGSVMEDYSQGGLMVWGQATNGKSFGRTLSATDQVEIELDNGTWVFYAMAWENSSSIELNGSMGIRCAKGSSVNLSGEAVSVSLTLSQAGCSDSIFAGSATTLANSVLVVQGCESVNGITSTADTCTNNREDSSRISDKLPIRSARVTLMDHNNGVSSGTGLTRCIDFSSTQSGAWLAPPNGSLILPAGDSSGQNPFFLKTDFYFSGLNCDDSDATNKRTIVSRGYAQTTAKRKYMADNPSGLPSTHYLSVEMSDEEICANGRALKEPFAAGDGSSGFPFVICSAKQLYETLSHVNKATNSYRLAVDINLNRHSNGVSNLDNLITYFQDIFNNTNYPCWDVGQNFQPIGSNYSVCNDYDAVSWSGSFDGNNHTISGLRMRIKDSTGVGFIGNWAPAASGNFIRDLRLVSPEVEGGYKVGALVGTKSNAILSSISNIHITDMDVEGRGSSDGSGSVGGIIGEGQALKIYKSSTQGKVSSNSGGTGGVGGFLLDMILLDEIRSNSRVDTTRAMTAPYGVGGLVGQLHMLSGVKLSHLSHEGHIYTQGQNVGGLFGTLNSDVALTDFYSNTAVYLSGPVNHNFGGIVGDFSSSETPLRGYFSGHVIDECVTGCNLNYFSTSAVTPSNFYYVNGSLVPSGTAQGTGLDNDGSGIYSIVSPLSTGSWVHNAGGMPRLVWEEHPCALVENVATFGSQTGRGTLNNPFTICSPMHWNTLVNMEAQGSETHFKVLSPLNLVNAAMGGTIEQNIHLKGQKGAMLFGFRIFDSYTYPLYLNLGKITQLDLSNIHINYTTSTSITGLINQNSGLVKNVNILSGSLNSGGAVYGVIYTNGPSGKVEGMNVNLNISSGSDIAGFAYYNEHQLGTSNKGLISDVSLRGSIGIAGTDKIIIGFVASNEGIIRRVELENRFQTSSEQNSVVKFVGTNSSSGQIHDIHITPHSSWRFNVGTTDVSSIANGNLGSIARVVDEGEFLEIDNTSSSVSGDAFKPVKTNSGTLAGIISVPSGRLIYEGQVNTLPGCVSGNLSIPLPSAPFDGDYFDNDNDQILDADNVIWVKISGNGRPAKYFEVSDLLVGSNINFEIAIDGLSTGDCDPSNHVQVIQGYNTTPALSAPYFPENDYNSFDSSLFTTGDWASNIVDVLDMSDPVNNLSPFNRMLAIQAHYLGVTVLNSPPALPIWELEEDRISLFRLDR